MDADMKRPGKIRNLLIILLIALTMIAMMAISTQAQPGRETAIVYLVRHAEKMVAGRDPELSVAGKKRASELSSMLRDAGIHRIYSTDFKRSRETATPLADRLGLDIEIYDWKKLDSLTQSLKQTGQRSLVVGHSNTTSELVERLGGEPGSEIDEAGEYDRLYIVTVSYEGQTSSVLIHYGQ